MQRFYDDEGTNFAVLLGLGFCYHGITDTGEVLSTIERVPRATARRGSGSGRRPPTGSGTTPAPPRSAATR